MAAWCRWLLNKIVQGSSTELPLTIGTCSTFVLCNGEQCNQCEEVCTMLFLLLRLLVGSSIKISLDISCKYLAC